MRPSTFFMMTGNVRVPRPVRRPSATRRQYHKMIQEDDQNEKRNLYPLSFERAVEFLSFQLIILHLLPMMAIYIYIYISSQEQILKAHVRERRKFILKQNIYLGSNNNGVRGKAFTCDRNTREHPTTYTQHTRQHK
jgi:hypothetical protein